MPETVYDVFISYRRKGGFETAKHLNDLLVRDGYSVSFDIDTLREGDFDTALLRRIDQCVDFLLVVDAHAFDRTIDPNFDPKKDWLRTELAYALKLRKNIIPILLSGVAGFPDNLPDDVAGVATKNGPEYSTSYFDTFYGRLKTFMHALPRNAQQGHAASSSTSLPNLKVMPDMACRFYIDGEVMGDLQANEIRKFPLAQGEYVLKFVSTENAADCVMMDFSMPAIDKVLKVELQPVCDNRMQEEARKRQEEEKRKREEEERQRKLKRVEALKSEGYVDLGLPSGTLWKDQNEPCGLINYDEAVKKYGSFLPTNEQCIELKDKCKWTWMGKGMKVTGPNGNSIVLPAEGYRGCDGSVNYVGSDGYYWSATAYGSDDAWYLDFNSGGAYTYYYDRCGGQSVRLVQDK